MTDSSSTTVNSYSVHEDQLKWFDVPLVAGAKRLFGESGTGPSYAGLDQGCCLPHHEP
jgi:hypothetical protein